MTLTFDVIIGKTSAPFAFRLLLPNSEAMKRLTPACTAALMKAISVSGGFAGVVEMTASWSLKASSNSCSGKVSAILMTVIPGSKVAFDDWREMTVTLRSGLFRSSGSTNDPSLPEAY